MKECNTSQRLKQIMKERNLKQVDILKLCEPYCKDYGVTIQKSDLSQYVSGKTIPGQNKTYILSLALDVSPVWLMGYSVPMRDTSTEPLVFVEDGDVYSLSEAPDNIKKNLGYVDPPPKKTFIDKYNELDDFGKKAVERLIDIEYERVLNEKKNERRTYTIRLAEIGASAGTGNWIDDCDFEEIEVEDVPEARMADFAVRVHGDSMNPDYSNGDIVFVLQQPSIYEGQVGIFCVNGSVYIKELGENELISTNPDFDNIKFEENDEITCFGRVTGIAVVV